MKRGKDDEKIAEPMFPRLHVNDADKGGPRAPPRNKMALYEQLSIPSQRFNRHGMLPHNANNTTSLVPPGSSGQACGIERNLYFQHQVSSSAPIHPAGKFVSQKSHMANARSLAQHDQRKTVGEEDDFMVPVFVNSGRAQSHVRTKNGVDNGKPTPIIPISSRCLVEIQEVSGTGLKQNGSLSASSRQEVRDVSKDNPKQGASLNSLHLSARGEMDVDKSALKCDRLNDSDACLRQESRNRFNQDGGEMGVKDTDNGVDSQLRSGSHLGEGHSSPDEVDNDREYCRNRACVSIQPRNGEESDGVSETSMVDSISSMDISPDDVVGIIGQKRFWKARRAIANQQRIFAVQVFELHRLIKVQRLIAASPHLWLDDGAYLGNSSLKASPVKKLLPPEYVVKSLPRAVKHKDDSEKANHRKMECSAENTVGKTATLSSSKNNNGHQPSNCTPLVGNPPPAPAATDTQVTSGGGGGGSWCFPPQPPLGNHQWLIPVMSPSEGLIYKPYPGPGLVGSGCGGYYGHFIPTPIPAGNFMGGPAYGVLASPLPYHQGVGFPTPGLNYFPSYGMPAMNPNFSGQQSTEQMNQFGHAGNLSGATLNTQQQSSCNFPNPKSGNGAAAQPPPSPPTKFNRDSTQLLQGSTGSSPGERGGARVNSENALPFFPTTPAAANAGAPSATTETTAAAAAAAPPPPPPTTTTTATASATAPRVIRVVPHNPTVASESAARIFQSIQEERRQHESV